MADDRGRGLSSCWRIIVKSAALEERIHRSRIHTIAERDSTKRVDSTVRRARTFRRRVSHRLVGTIKKPPRGDTINSHFLPRQPIPAQARAHLRRFAYVVRYRLFEPTQRRRLRRSEYCQAKAPQFHAPCPFQDDAREAPRRNDIKTRHHTM